MDALAEEGAWDDCERVRHGRVGGTGAGTRYPEFTPTTMSDDNSMEVDEIANTLLPSPMPSSSLRPGMGEFKTQMTETSKLELWPARIISAGSDKAEMRNVLISVLFWATAIASSSGTALQKNVITFSGRLAIKTYVQSLSDDEVEECKNLVQKGDWVGLIKHRMYLARFRRRYINAVLAQRNFRNQLKISLSIDELKRGKLRFSSSLLFLLYLRVLVSAKIVKVWLLS